MRVLLASTEGAGHYNPLVPFAEALTRRGDEVMFVVPPKLHDTVLAGGHPFRIGAAPPAAEVDSIWARVPNVSPDEAAVLVNREIFGRLGVAAMLPAVENACREWQPGLILHEAAEYASAIAADRHGIPHAQVAISRASAEEGSLRLAAPALEPYGDGIVERIRMTPYLSRFPASADPPRYPVTRRYREDVPAPGRPLPDWWDGADGPLLYVTFGSVAGDMPGEDGTSIGAVACRAALAAVAEMPVRVLLTVGRATDLGQLGPIPRNVHVEAWVSQADVLAEASAVVCHGGSGTTLGTLAAGVPLVVVPLFADQPGNARCVADAGAGMVVEPVPGAAVTDRIGPRHAAQLRSAIGDVLGDPRYRAAAGRVAAEMRAAQTIGELRTAEFGPPA